jgi:hypothetical protein
VAQEGEAIRKAQLEEISDAASSRFSAIRAEEVRRREAQRYGVQVRDMFLRAMQAGIDLPDEQRQLDALLETGRQRLRAAA